MERQSTLCPRSKSNAPGHYMKNIPISSIPKTTHKSSIRIEKKDPDHLTIVDFESGEKVVWFFHRGGALKIDRALETLVDYEEKVVYGRFLGEQSCRVFFCASNEKATDCPDALPEEDKERRPHSFLDNLGFHAHKSQSRTIETNIEKSSAKTAKEDATVLIESAPTKAPTFQVPKRPQRFFNQSPNIEKPALKDGLTPPEWFPANKAVVVKGVTIACGMIYVGQPSLGQGDWDMSPAVINLHAPVKLAYPDRKASTVGYWPSYSEITPEARAGYLQWLSGPRNNPKDPISWVFLFFLGLERRIIVDLNSKESAVVESAKADLPAIKKEIFRLREIYGDHISFNRYSEGLIHLIDIVSGSPGESKIEGVRDSRQYPWETRVALGKLANERTPLPVELALTYARSHPSITLPKPAIRCVNEFDALFNIKYREKYGFGMPLPELKQRLVFSYKPATAGMGLLSIRTELPDVSRSVKVENILKQLVADCSKMLNRYSRFLASNPDGRGSLKALSLLPVELLSEKEKEQLAEEARASAKKSSKQVAPEPLIKIPTPVIIDHALVAKKEAETKKVSKLLHDILSDEVVPSAAEAPNISNESNVSSDAGSPWLAFELDEAHWNLMLILGTRGSWDRKDFVAECKKLDLMPNGALDMLNEATLAYADEPLTDGEDPIIVDQKLVKDMIS